MSWKEPVNSTTEILEKFIIPKFIIQPKNCIIRCHVAFFLSFRFLPFLPYLLFFIYILLSLLPPLPFNSLLFLSVFSSPSFISYPPFFYIPSCLSTLHSLFQLPSLLFHSSFKRTDAKGEKFCHIYGNVKQTYRNVTETLRR